jgi:hypothetical protein
MSFYLAIRKLQACGYKLIRKYPSCEIWNKGDTTVSIPDLPRLPRGITQKIKELR